MQRAVASVRGRWAWLFLALAAAAVYPALTQNIGALAYDAATVHLYRSYVFSGAISEGVLYPRWVQFLHLGLGSPLFTFNPPLPYYALDLLYRLGIPHPIGWRLLIAAGLLAAGAGAYCLAYLLTGQRWPALLAGVAYLYAPYVLRNALERGSLETFSMFLYPWVLWGLLWLARRPSPGRFVIATMFWAACIASHVLGPLMLAPIAFLVAALAGWRYRTLAPALALLAGVLLAAPVWAPIIPEQNYVRLDLNFEDNYVASPLLHPIPLARLLAPSAVYDTAGGNNGSGDAVGIVQTILLLLAVPAAAYAWWRGQRRLAAGLAAAALAGSLLFWMLTGASDFVWRVFEPVLTRLEFRSRLMGLQALAAALAAGLALALLPGRAQRILGTALALLLVAAALPILYVGLQHQYAGFGDRLSWSEVRAAEISSGGTAFTSWNEFAPRWRRAPFGAELQRELGAGFDPAARPLASSEATVSVRSAQVHSSAWELELAAAQAGPVTLYLLYYPRWQAAVDGLPVAARPEPVTGLTQVDVPAGEHRLTLRYTATGAEQAGLAVSGLTLLVLAGLAVAALARRSAGRDAPARTAPPSGELQPAPSLWLLGGLTVALLFKGFYVDPATNWFRCSSTSDRVCGMEQTVDAEFANGLRLRGYTVVTPQLAPGGELVVNVAWQVNEPITARLRSFVHVRNSDKSQAVYPETGSEIWIQDDHDTPAGLLNTEFTPGKIYTDEFRVPVPPDMPPGRYYLEVGWTDPASGEQVDVRAETVKAPLQVLWRSILLPAVEVR